MRESRTRSLVLVGSGAVALGAVAAAYGSWDSDANLRGGVIPWAGGALLVGMALLVLGTLRGDLGRPWWLLRGGSCLALLGLGLTSAFLFGTGLLGLAGSDLLSAGDTSLSAAGTLAASVSALLILPAGLLAFGVAVLRATSLPRRVRGLPLLGTGVLLLGPVLLAVLPDQRERTVLVVWPVLLAAVWATYGLLLRAELVRRSGHP